MLVDQVELELKAGNGGDGIVSWRREKFVPKGGPDGGDGGRGGSIFVTASHNQDTLANYRYRKIFQAEAGHNGQSRKRIGSAGQDLDLHVPVGTKIIDVNSGQVLVDLIEPDQRVMVAKGGRGGLGNPHFVSATHQNPFEATKGQPGQRLQIKFELQFVADLAVVGEPNAGKSSLIKSLTGRDLVIGAYPFSTTEPMLAVMPIADQRITLIDLPGLIEGAHQGKGLGDEFLRHTERVKGLIHVVDATHPDLTGSTTKIEQELKSFNPRLPNLPTVLVINKIDLLTKTELDALTKKFPKAHFVSAKTGTGLEKLKVTLGQAIG